MRLEISISKYDYEKVIELVSSGVMDYEGTTAHLYKSVANGIDLSMDHNKKGKWIKIGDKGFGYSDTVICKCSVCEYQTEFTGKIDDQRLVVDMERAYKHCPNCGIEMDEE